MSSEEDETKISNNEKWQISELIDTWWQKTSLRKSHLETIEKSYRDDIRLILNEWTDSSDKKHVEKEDELEKTINRLDATYENRFDAMEKELIPIKSFVNFQRWLSRTIIAGVIVGGIAYLFKRFG